ncbi:EamA family transporter [Bacillus canaveralius]|uniref:EamA family transporter n=1 Tax=Bacillus canaveralius TaxID=1403243 RepID=A0A2N5GQW0_9BACI|nr:MULTISPECIES: EamA family transporter [Bacillus]PLR85617.1 EamA family transporter [Bacillus canaveralius]PLR86457.1 EamA family transporter [Bacillus sp. V33-4]PLR94722.1 EamA family transporter [Bacillus canaveralius]RSK50481.1 EamA family transporter [Bacillus canaveralius]
MSLWLIYALLAAISAALVSIFGKIGLQNIDPNTATAVRAIIMAVFLIGVVAFEGNLQKIPEIINQKRTFMFIILSGIAGATSWLFYFMALRVGKVSQVAPIDKLSVVLATVLAILFLGEKISLLNGLGVALIAIGVVLTALS